MLSDNWQKYKMSGEQALSRGALSEAESMWLAALEEAEDFHENDSRRAVTYEGLSEAYFRQGKNKDAETTCRRLLSLYRRVHGPDHIDVGITSSNLAMLLHMEHNYADAEPLYKQSIAIKTKVLGGNHPDVMRLLEGYADLLMKTHREEEARHLQVCAQGMSTGKWGRTALEVPALKPNGTIADPPVPNAKSFDNQFQSGNHSPASVSQNPTQTVNHGLKIDPTADRKGSDGKTSQSHHRLDRTMLNIPQKNKSGTHSQMEPVKPTPKPSQSSTDLPPKLAPQVAPSAPKSDEAKSAMANPVNWFVYKEFAEEALRRGLLAVAETQWRAALVEAEIEKLDNQKLAYALDSLADILCRLKKFGEAESLMTRCIALKTQALGKVHPLVAMSVATLARLHYQQQNYSMAERMMGDCIEIYEKGLGDHPETASALYNFAMIYHQQTKLDQAETIYKKCWEMRKRILGPEHPDTRKVFDNFAKILAAKTVQPAAKPQPIKPTGGTATTPTKMNSGEQAITGSWKILELPDTMRLNPDD